MYRNINDYKLRYTDVDPYDNLKLSSLLSFLEESACLSADELGFGYDDVAPKNIGFVIVNWYIKLERNIKLGETLSVHTWPIKPRHMIFVRDFEIYSGKEKVGVATSRWCMVDTKTFAILPSNAYFNEGDFDNYNTERSVEFSGWKIPRITEGELAYSKIATYSDYDHYFHVNNTKYADFMLDVFSVEELENLSVSSVQITYVKQCKQGEKLDFYKSSDGDGYFIEGRVGDELRIQMRIKFVGV
ncbi:MAG: hypothetical protein K2K60_00930 [Clostridia bacterium]|nr:hypothetical protein [Clostridia bacterium]